MQEPNATSAPELIAEARAGVDRHVGDLLAACEDIRDFALKVGPGWTGRPMMDGVDRLAALLFARATGTYWAIVELLRIGFGDQGAMLARSLFEDMVDMHWITVEPEIAVERFPKHHEHSEMLIADALRANPNTVSLVSGGRGMVGGCLGLVGSSRRRISGSRITFRLVC
jgi:Family of unknown function (DUF5677)